MQISVVCTGKISLTQRLSKYTMSIGREVRDREEHQPANSEITRGSPHLRLRKGRSAPRKDVCDSGFAQTQSYLKAEMGSPGLLQPKQAV